LRQGVDAALAVEYLRLIPDTFNQWGRRVKVPLASTTPSELTYSGLSSSVMQAHIHFAKVHVPGGAIVFFCSNLATTPAGTKALSGEWWNRERDDRSRECPGHRWTERYSWRL